MAAWDQVCSESGTSGLKSQSNEALSTIGFRAAIVTPSNREPSGNVEVNAERVGSAPCGRNTAVSTCETTQRQG